MKKLRVRVFSPIWCIVLVLTVMLAVLIASWSSRQSAETILNILKWVSVGEMIFLLTYKFSLRYAKNFEYNFYNELPCYLCNMTLVIAFIAATTSNRYCMAYCSTVGWVGGVIALVMPDYKFRDIPLFSRQFVGYYGVHCSLFLLAISFLTCQLYVPAYLDILGVIGILFVCLVIAHCTNYFLRKSRYPKANYIYTYGPDGIAILEKFWNLIPIPFVYLIPVIIVYSCGIAVFVFVYHLFI